MASEAYSDKLPNKAQMTQLIDAVNKIGNGIATSPTWWGFEEDMSILDEEERISYIGEASGYTPMSMGTGGSIDVGDWQPFIDIFNNHPWMVRNDGTPDYRLMDTDYSKKIDGSASDASNIGYNGGAYAWVKKVYKSETMRGSKRVVKFSFEKLDGFEPIGFIDQDGVELPGMWMPMAYGSIDSNGKMRSIFGTQPCYSKTCDQEYTAITANGNRHVFYGGPFANLISDLQIMLGGGTDVQIHLGYGNCSGYNESATPSGTNGVLPSAIVGGGRFYGTTDGKSLNKFFHSIVPATYQQHQRDPYLQLVDGNYKVSPNYVYDISGTSIESTGLSLTKTDGLVYPHYYQVIPGFGAVPVSKDGYKGSTSTGGCDSLYVNTSGVRVGVRFGYCGNGRVAGPRCLALDGAPSAAGWNVGASDLLKPPVGVAL
jgi:hypothetical protein